MSDNKGILMSGTFSQTPNLADFSAFLATVRRPSQVLSTWFDRRVYGAERPLSFTTRCR